MKKITSRSFYLLCVHVIPRSESDKMSVICRRWDGHRPRTSSKSVAQLIRHLLQVVGGEFVVIVKDVVMCWSTCTLRDGISVSHN